MIGKNIFEMGQSKRYGVMCKTKVEIFLVTRVRVVRFSITMQSAEGHVERGWKLGHWGRGRRSGEAAVEKGVCAATRRWPPLTHSHTHTCETSGERRVMKVIVLQCRRDREKLLKYKVAQFGDNSVRSANHVTAAHSLCRVKNL